MDKFEKKGSLTVKYHYHKILAHPQNYEKPLLASCLSIRLSPSVRIEKLGFHLMNFHENWYLSIFLNSVQKIQVSLKSVKNKGVLYMKTYVHLL